jgi:Asp-tRNA(Asn)/Glu-tRNA(Gln) amidotransferase C subunit
METACQEEHMPVTKDFLKRMIEELDLIPMSDEELEIVLPKVRNMMDGMEQLSELDLSEIRTSLVFRADPGNKSTDA